MSEVINYEPEVKKSDKVEVIPQTPDSNDEAGQTKEKLEINQNDAPRLEKALGNKKIDKESIQNFTKDELLSAEKQESGALSVLFMHQQKQEKDGIKISGMELGERYTDTNLKKFQVGQKTIVDFKGNKEAYWKIGLSQMLPPYVRGVRVTKTKKDGTKEIVESEMRAKVDGGFYDKKGDYIPVFTGDEVEVTQVDDEIFQKWEKNRGEILEQQKTFFEKSHKDNPSYKAKIEDLPPELQVAEKTRIDEKLRSKTLAGILDTFGPALTEECVLQNFPESLLPCIISLGKSESGWNPDAKNPNSTATGIGQFIESTALSMQKTLLREGRDIPRDPQEFLARMRKDARLQVTMFVRLAKDSAKRLNALVPEIDPLKNPNELSAAFLAIAHHDGSSGVKMYIRWWKDNGMPEHIPMFPDEETAKKYAVASFQRNRSLGGAEGSNGVIRYAANIAKRATSYQSEVAAYVNSAKNKVENTAVA